MEQSQVDALFDDPFDAYLCSIMLTGATQAHSAKVGNYRRGSGSRGPGLEAWVEGLEPMVGEVSVQVPVRPVPVRRAPTAEPGTVSRPLRGAACLQGDRPDASEKSFGQCR